ncbi:MAG: hypothetical protein Q8S19_04295, partial [Bacillota bacterium]|nr:hypothetical protein [Bacillota bacterium]
SYETSWDGGAEALADRATTHTLVGLEVPFEWEEGTGAIRMHIIVNDDDSLAIYVDAPYFEVYERHPQHHGVANIERFIRLASCVFAPSVFLYGHIGVESYLPSLQNILALRAEITDDWAFYGKDLVPHLRILDTLRHQAVQCTEIGQDGVFVRWSNWWQNAYSPQAWKDSLKCVRQHLVRK